MTHKRTDYTSAIQICQDLGLELAEPKTVAESQAIQAGGSDVGSFFLGAKRGDQDYANFYWNSDNSKIVNGLWRDGEPNDAGGEPCIVNVGGTDQWNDDKCNKSYNVICQKRNCQPNV